MNIGNVITQLKTDFDEVETAGRHQGYNNGFNSGYVDGRSKGLLEGEHNVWSEFWDDYQEHGTRRNYNQTFDNSGFLWTVKTFKPKYDIICTSAKKTFYNGNRDILVPIATILKNQGLTLDTSQATDMTDFCAYGWGIQDLPTIDCTSTKSLSQVFMYCEALTSIENFVVKAENTYNKTFNRCISLATLNVVGTIGNNGFNVQWSPLTHDSLMSIINALQDKTGDISEEWTVTLGASNKAKLTEEEQKIAKTKGWYLA